MREYTFLAGVRFWFSRKCDMASDMRERESVREVGNNMGRDRKRGRELTMGEFRGYMRSEGQGGREAKSYMESVR